MSDQGKRRLFLSGLRALAAELRGDERIHAGMRPYGLHAGNKLPLVIYPYLLAEALEARGVTPRFRYTLTLNDWETDTLEHPEGYPLNFTPRGRTFQFQPDPAGCCPALVDHWERRMREETAFIAARFPEVRIEVLRASGMRALPGFLETIRVGLAQPRALRQLLLETVGPPVLEEPLQYAGAVCPSCRSVQGVTEYQPEAKGGLSFRCRVCGHDGSQPLAEADLWLYVHLLGAAKYVALRPDVWVFGGDFVEYRTVDFLDRLVEHCTGVPPAMQHLITPMLLARDGRKMSKSLGNTEDVPTPVLLPRVRAAHELLLPLE